jgi:hypothetical protein
MKKRLLKFGVSNISIFVFLTIVSFCSLTGCSFENRNLVVHDYRFYLYMSEFKIPDGFTIEIKYFEGGETFAKTFSRPSNGKMFYVDVPSNLQGIYLNIKNQSGMYYLNDYPVRKIHYDVIYNCRDEGYRFDNIDYVSNLSLSCIEFANYVLANLNSSSDSYAAGYNSYKQINNFYYGSLTDKNDISTTSFVDSYTGKQTTVKAKMDELEASASKTPQDGTFLKLFWSCFAIAFTFVLPVIIFLCYKLFKLWKKRNS